MRGLNKEFRSLIDTNPVLLYTTLLATDNDKIKRLNRAVSQSAFLLGSRHVPITEALTRVIAEKGINLGIDDGMETCYVKRGELHDFRVYSTWDEVTGERSSGYMCIHCNDIVTSGSTLEDKLERGLTR